VSLCPACPGGPLTLVEATPGVEVELCRACRGMLVDAPVLVSLAGLNDSMGLDVEAATEPRGGGATLGPCLRCNTHNWQTRAVPGAAGAGLLWCGTCSMVWLLAGELERLREWVIAERWRARAGASLGPAGGAAPGASVPVPSDAGEGDRERPRAPDAAQGPASIEPADRISFEHGLGNVLGAPLGLGLGLLFCSTAAGRFFGALVGMPFHELGHALASWLSSRFAVPLPFFTVWHEEQSVPFGLGVAAVLVWLGWHSWHERRRFGLVLALCLLVLQVGLSWFVPVRFTSMLQILSGGLGEIVLGALVLIAFHFPLPDRLRWDFWRWPALLPASLCLAHALVLWSRAVRDVRHIPWGAAIGSAADGDMNRLVQSFGWSPAALATFYLGAGITSLAALSLTQAWMWRRQHRARAHLRRQAGPASEHRPPTPR
jgi:Zn-finger nucleic acid-binding protein